MNTHPAAATDPQVKNSMITDRLNTNDGTIGANTAAGWLMGVDADGLELHVTPDHALVLVDRSPIINGTDGSAYLRSGAQGLRGAHLSLVNEVEIMNDTLMHGVYSGSLGGTAVLMDQYVQIRNGVPRTIVRMITRVNGSVPAIAFDQMEFVMALINKSVDATGPTLKKI